MRPSGTRFWRSSARGCPNGKVGDGTQLPTIFDVSAKESVVRCTFHCSAFASSVFGGVRLQCQKCPKKQPIPHATSPAMKWRKEWSTHTACSSPLLRRCVPEMAIARMADIPRQPRSRQMDRLMQAPITVASAKSTNNGQSSTINLTSKNKGQEVVGFAVCIKIV